MTKDETVTIETSGKDIGDSFGTGMWAMLASAGFLMGVADAGAENLDLVPTLLGFGVPLFAWIAFCRENRWLEFLFLGASIVSFIGWIVSIA